MDFFWLNFEFGLINIFIQIWWLICNFLREQISLSSLKLYLSFTHTISFTPTTNPPPPLIPPPPQPSIWYHHHHNQIQPTTNPLPQKAKQHFFHPFKSNKISFIHSTNQTKKINKSTSPASTNQQQNFYGIMYIKEEKEAISWL